MVRPCSWTDFVVSARALASPVSFPSLFLLFGKVSACAVLCVEPIRACLFSCMALGTLYRKLQEKFTTPYIRWTVVVSSSHADVVAVLPCVKMRKMQNDEDLYKVVKVCFQVNWDLLLKSAREIFFVFCWHTNRSYPLGILCAMTLSCSLDKQEVLL